MSCESVRIEKEKQKIFALINRPGRWSASEPAPTCSFMFESLRMGFIFEDFFKMLDTVAPMGPKIPDSFAEREQRARK